MSPDLLNVVLNNGAVERRGGFIPLIKDAPKLNAIRNVGHHGKGNDGTNTGDTLVVPGCLQASHTGRYEGLTSYTISFFCRIGDLTKEHLGNGTASGGNNPFGSSSPFDVRVRPILSKGPITRSKSNVILPPPTRDPFGPEHAATGYSHWDQSNAYGPSGEVFVGTVASGTPTTITTDRDHGLSNGDRVRVILEPGGLTGTIAGVSVITVTGATTFTLDSSSTTGTADDAVTVVAEPTGRQGMPFCIYLWRGTPPSDWQFAFSGHVDDGSNFALATVSIPRGVSGGVDPEIGPTYHIIASCNSGNANGFMMRVGVWDELQRKFVYTQSDTANLTGFNLSEVTPCPIQVFDCPQEFIEAPGGAPDLFNTTNMLVRPPGLGLTTASPGGGYWFHSKRFEGEIEDILIQDTALTSTADTSKDMRWKHPVDPSDKTALNHWSMMRRGSQIVEDETKNGNHLYFVPDGPITDDLSGGVRSDRASSWYFNGQTSYALVDCENEGLGPNVDIVKSNPNWRFRDIPVDTLAGELPPDGAFQDAVRTGVGYGVRVDFWPHSTGEPFEQVLCEIHSVLRLTIGIDGRIRAMFQDDTINTSVAVSPRYAGPLVSDFKVQVGHRYTVQVTSSSTAGPAKMWVNDIEQDKTFTVPDATADDMRWPISGMTIGMGCKLFTNISDTASPGPVEVVNETGTPNQINTDGRTGFVGRIEEVQILVGREAHTTKKGYRDQVESDFSDTQSSLWDVPASSLLPRVPAPSDAGDSASLDNIGRAVGVSKHVQTGKKLRYIATDVEGDNLNPPGFLTLKDGGGNEMKAVKYDIFRVFARWSLDQRDDAAGSSGAYSQATEFLPTVSNGNLIRPDPMTICHVQRSVVTDDLNVMGILERRCRDSDTILEDDIDSYVHTGSANEERAQDYSTHRVRPYPVRSPREVGPQWAPGIAMPLIGTNPITLIADWQHLPTAERFLVTAVGRQLYWNKPLWRADSPFDEPNPFSIWGFGTEEDFIRVDQDTSLNDFLGVTQTVSVWVKPHRIDGTRLICAKGLPALGTDDDEWNWIMWIDDDGAMHVAGTEGSGTNTWKYRDDGGPAGANPTTAIMPNSKLKAGVWNHVYMLIGILSDPPATEGLIMWVNGVRLTMVADAVLGGITGAVADEPEGDLWLMGLPQAQRQTRFGPLAAWHGLMTEFRMRDNEDPEFSPTAGVHGVVPRERYTDNSNTTFLLHLNEGSGWSFNSSAAAFPLSSGISHLKEVIPIAEGLEESTKFRYDSSVFRDRMYVTNGESFPQEITFERFSRPDGPFRVNRMGIEVGGVLQPAVPIPLYSARHSTPVVATDYLADGIYQLWVAFYDYLGRESEPMQLLADYTQMHLVAAVDLTPGYTVADPTVVSIDSFSNADAAVWTAHVHVGQEFTINFDANQTGTTPNIPLGFYIGTKLTSTTFSIPIDVTAVPGPLDPVGIKIYPSGYRIDDVPRSTNPATIGRRIFFSATGGGAPLFHSDLADNESPSFEILKGGTGIGIEIGRKLPAPRAKLIEVITGNTVLGNIPDVEAGKGAFFWSDGAEPVYFPLSNNSAIDSRDGKEMVGMKATLSTLFFFKRDSTWQFSFHGTAIPGEAPLFLRPVNQSVGLGGGTTLYDNIAFGAGERGVYRFDGSNVEYASESLEGDWRGLPSITDEVLLDMFGGFYRDGSMFWLSIRGSQNAYNDTIYALHIAVGDRRVWTKLAPPPHTFMRDITHPVTQRPKMAIGSTSGQLLIYDDSMFMDGVSDDLINGTAPTLSGSGTGQLTTLTVSSPAFFDTTLQGLRGATIDVTFNSVTYRRTIETNSELVLEWRDPLGVDPAGGAVTFVIGGYSARWSSGWLAPQALGNYMLTRDLDLEFAPTDPLSVILDVNVTSALGVKPTQRAFPAVSELLTQDLTQGYQTETMHLRDGNRGRFFRVQFSNSGIRNPFQVTGWGFRYNEEGPRGQPQ